MLSRFRESLSESQADILAVVILLALSALWAWLTWGCFFNPIGDQGWYMQVAARVVAGEVLYRDVFWAYGPLPAYILGSLFRLRMDVAMLSLLHQILAVLGCLLTYRAARFLLSVPLALLGTVAVFLGGWWGGFASYVLAYTGAMPLGAVLGLLFVVCLLSYLGGRRILWLVVAGIATGGALLTKPEFALACVGTGALILTGLALLPEAAGLASDRDSRIRALGAYVMSTAMVAGIGYGVLVYQAGWSNVWAGISGYDEAAILFWRWPPWGTPRSWCYIVSGLGVYALTAMALLGVLAPAVVRKHVLPACVLVGLSLALVVLPWSVLFFARPELLFAMVSSWTTLLQECIRVLWAPGPLLLTGLIIALGFRWLRAYRRRQTISRVEWYYAVLVVYSALLAARSYLNPLGNWSVHYVDTLFPVLVFSVVNLIPRAAEQWWQVRPRRSRAQLFLAVILSLYAVVGLAWNVGYLSKMNTALVTPRGTALFFSDLDERRPWVDTLQHIISYTEPGDSIVVLGAEPGFYFLSGRKNPLRQDFILPGMGSSPADAREIVRRLETHAPRLIIIPQGIKRGKAWLWDSDIGREYYENLMPVWQYVHDYYQVRIVVGGEEWGYAIHEPHQGRSP